MWCQLQRRSVSTALINSKESGETSLEFVDERWHETCKAEVSGLCRIRRVTDGDLTMSIDIERVESDKQLREFVKVAWEVYANDPNWVPALYHERLHLLNKRKNPFFEHAEADYFIARRDGRAVGSIAAILNHRHNQFHNENVAHFGIFEVLEDREAAVALLDAATAWAKGHGMHKILGPMNLSTNDECGLLVDGFEGPPVIMMTYNPHYYVDFIEAAGFGKAMNLWAWYANVAEIVNNMPKKLLRIVSKAKERYQLDVRNLNLKDWDNEVARVRRIYNKAWERNWGFVPMTDAEFDQLAKALKPVIDPSIAFIVEKDGENVGFALSLPDANQPLNRFHPGPSLLASYLGAGYAALNKRSADGLRVLVLGVIDKYRKRGIDALLYYETAKAAAAQGYKWAEASWILESNEMMNRSLAMLGARIYRTYRIYEKTL
jgi:GNAT superfamily N-acetyltransferase